MSHGQKGYETIQPLQALARKIETIKTDHLKLVKENETLKQQCKRYCQNLYEKEMELKKREDSLDDKEQQIEDLMDH